MSEQPYEEYFDEWYNKNHLRLNDLLIATHAVVENEIMAKTDEWKPVVQPYDSLLTLAEWSKGALTFIRGVLRKQEEDTAETRKTLEAINHFVEHYTPLLEELQNERRFRNNVGGGKQHAQ